METGSLVAPGAAAFTLADLSSVKASFGVPDMVVVNLGTGGRLNIYTEALPDRQSRARFTNIAAVADSSTRLFKCRSPMRIR